MGAASLQVTVRAGGTVRDGLGARRVVDLPPGSTVGDLLTELDRVGHLPPGALDRVAVSVQGAIVPRSRALADADEVSLVAPVAGG